MLMGLLHGTHCREHEVTYSQDMVSWWKKGWYFHQPWSDYVEWRLKKLDSVCTFTEFPLLLLMEEILHQLLGRLYPYSQGFIHPRWLFGISSINSTKLPFSKLRSLWHPSNQRWDQRSLQSPPQLPSLVVASCLQDQKGPDRKRWSSKGLISAYRNIWNVQT